MLDKLVFFAAPSPEEILWVTAVIASILVAAVALEVYRRGRERRARIATEWRQVYEIAKERQLSKDEIELLERLIRKYMRNAPLRAVTMRYEFDVCINGEIPFSRDVDDPEDIEALENEGVLLRDLRVRLGLDYVPYGQRILSTRELSRGQRIWVAAVDHTPVNWARVIVASVDEAFLHLSSGGAAALPQAKPGDVFQCRMWREQDARYMFHITVKRVDKSPPVWVVRHTDRLDRMQSRAHYRIHTEYNTTFSILNAPLDGDMSDVHERQAITKTRGRITSLSGGGFAAVIGQAIPKQVLLRTLLAIPTSEKPIQIVGKPVDVSPMSGGHFLVRAAFVAMSDEARDRIAKHVAHHQRHTGGAEDDDEDQP